MDNSLKEIIQSEFFEAGFNIGEKESNQFSSYLFELKKWNKKINLTSITDEVEVVKKLFISSANYIKLFPQARTINMLDLGSGGGIPGIPIKILKPEISVTFLDSSRKKIAFIKHIARLLEFSSVKCIAQRAETLIKASPKKGGYDCIVVNWLGTIEMTLNLSLPLLVNGGIVITRKGDNLETELQSSTISRQKYSIKEIIKILDNGNAPYRLIAIEKCFT